MISTHSIKRTPQRRSLLDQRPPGASVWKRVWGIGSLALACLASPCCAPLLIPVLLSLLAGTPLSIFLAQSIGWVYASLTVLSLVSAYLGWRWLTQRGAAPPVPKWKRDSACACQADCSCRPATSGGEK